MPGFMSKKFMFKTFMSSKRRRIGVLAAAGTLAIGVAATAVLTSGPLAANAVTDADVASNTPAILSFAQARSALMQHVSQLRAAQAAAARANAQRAQAARAHAIHVQRANAAAAAKARAAAAAKAKAASSTSAPSSPSGTAASGSPEQIAQSMLSQFGWSSSQYSCLYPLWQRESNWSITASNPSTGAYGIPQALPGSRMASVGADWQTNAATQIKWGLEYIQSTYGSPCAAWAHSQADGWY